MLSRRQIKLLEHLWQYQEEYLTSKELAQELSVSDKTIQKDIVGINLELDESIAQIISKPGSGSRLEVNKVDLFNELISDESVTEQSSNIQEPKDRQLYILKLLLFEKDYVLINDLADILFVSRSTISNDIHEIKNLLKDYDLTIDSVPHKGIYVSGKERMKRHFILNFFFVSRFKNDLESFFNEEKFMENITIEEIFMIVLDEVRESNLKVSDYELNNIVLHISLSIKRIQDGFEFKKNVNNETIVSKETYEMSQRILHQIETIVNFKFPKEEANYLSLYFQNIRHNKSREKTPIQIKIERQLYDALKTFDEETGYQAHKDQILFDGLLTHLKQLFHRMNQDKRAINPLLSEIKQNHGESLGLVIKHLSKMPLFKDKPMSDDEWGYIALHIIAYIERFKSLSKLNVLVICATGIGSSQILKARLKNEFGSKINIVDVISYYEITDQLLDDVDLIVSSINLSRTVLKKTVVEVSVFLGDEDIERINQTIQTELSNKEPLEKIVEESSQRQSMLTKDYFDPQLFLRTEEELSKKTLLNEMIHQLKQKEVDFDEKALLDQLMLRERFNSVAFSDSIAVPHPIKGITRSMHVAIAVVPQGVYWDDEHPEVKIVFLLSPEKTNSGSLEEVSKAIVPLIENKEKVDQLVEAGTYEEFIEIFLNEQN